MTFVPLAPAGGISTTATDMARFMIAHLQLGQYGQGRILQQATAEEMHRTHFRHDPRVGGWAHGFAEGFHGSLRAIGHTGGTNDFFTEFTLVPEKNLGLFASFNGTGGLKAQQQLVNAFWDRYFPSEHTPVEPSPSSAERASRVAGSYGSTRSCSTTFCKAAGIFSSITFRVDLGGGIAAQLPFWGLRRYAEVEPWAFRQQDGEDVLVFHRNGAGQVDVLFSKNSVAEAYPRLPWYLTNTFSTGLMVTTVLIFLSAVLGWPVLRLFGRGSKIRPAAWARWLAGIIAVVFLASMVTMGLGLSDLNEVAFAIPPLVRISLNLALAAAIGSIAVVVAAVLAWRGNYWTLWGRLHYSVVALAAVAMVWFMSYWKLLGLG